MDNDRIVIEGARAHNLNNVSLTLPKNRLICFTGVSGSGKSSMAFDTIYAEGQRRYVESLSPYARHFMEQMEKPDVDRITGLPPAISIEQKAAGGNPRSTVGTMTEVYDYLRVLYSRLGTLHCLECGKPITGQTREQILDRIALMPERTRMNILAPVVRGRQGEFLDLFEDLQKQGFVRARVDEGILSLTEDPGLDRHAKHDVDVVVDRIILKPDGRTRLAEAVDTALEVGNGTIILNVVTGSEDAGVDTIMGTSYACADCGISYEEPTPQLFSFNIPAGMCPTCSGLGTHVEIDAELLIADPTKSLRDGAIATIDVDRNKWNRHFYEGVLKHFGKAGLDTPWADIELEAREKLLHGLDGQRIRFTYRGDAGKKGWTHNDTFEGIIPMLQRRFRETKNDSSREELAAFTAHVACADCGGARLRAEARAVSLGGPTLPELCALSVEDAHRHLTNLTLSESDTQIGQDALNEIVSRMEFLINVGLKYISLDRTAPTLSGGESQRIRLASQIGSGLVGVLYVLDEPSIGLHHRDNHRLLNALGRLRDTGNTVVVVEHDEDTMRNADLVVDFGPGPGVRGGEACVVGTVDDVIATDRSITGQFLSGRRSIAIPETRRSPNGSWLEVVGACHNNLKDIDVRIPLGVFTCVTGVSGSGKSSLIADTLLPALTRHFFRAKDAAGEHREVRGIENIDKVIHIDQSPIGRTPRSNSATYTGVLDLIRKLFADLPAAKVRGYKPGRFSFNVKDGRCEACSGNGATKVEMDFLSDIWVACPVCEGKRFNAETLQVAFRGKSIADVLDMDVQEALSLFENLPHVKRTLQTLHDVGLDYIKLGQPSPTLSGGEAQRIKLAKELCRKSTGKTLYILDEPTTGLHFHDIQHLLEVLHHFCDEGNTVVVIEHNMDVIKTADRIIDLGPEGGDEGGRVIAGGTPEEVATVEDSWTGQVLAQVLATGRTGGLDTPEQGDSDGAAGLPTVYEPAKRLTSISVTGAREHNLKNVSVDVPRERLVVFAGVSGSGKTSMALDTIYAEGQRRYVESLSSYARQFLGQVQKPKVDQIEGLSPAIAIEQKSAGRNPRSTVGTITQVYDYVRVIYAQLADVYCPDCQVPAGQQSALEVVERLAESYDGESVVVMAPVEPGKGEDYEALLARSAREGYVRARIDGEIERIDGDIEIDRRRTHVVEIVVDRLTVRAADRPRLGEAVEAAFSMGAGRLVVLRPDASDETQMNQHLSCPSCNRSFDRLTPQMFAFNRAHDLSASGMCPACQGMGTQQGLAEEAVVRTPNLSVADGAISLWGKPSGQFLRMLTAAGAELGFDVREPVSQLSEAARHALFHGDETRWIEAGKDGFRFQYMGLFPAIDRTLRANPKAREELGQVLSDVACNVCGGSRLVPQSRWARLRDVTIGDLCAWPIANARRFFDELALDDPEENLVGDVHGEICRRLQFLDEVGLEYVALDRRAPTLSGGEAQRIRLASQIGSGLTGVLYVLDEPTIGLHPRDNKRLLTALQRLRDLNNTVIVVEHDADTLTTADHVIDFGPGAGASGGQVVASAPPAELGGLPESITGKYLSGALSLPVPSGRRPGNGHFLEIVGARHHNLKNVDVRFPLGSMIVVTGVSGSGKSSLVNDILYRSLASTLHRAQLVPGLHDEVRNVELVDKVILIDQDPIGNSPQSNPATYSGVFDLLRQFYAGLPESRVRGYTARRFSTNVPGGRCERCQGYGKRHIEMHFLPDVWVECDACDGMRYNSETLEIRYGGISIGDVLAMQTEQALEHFRRVPRIRKLLATLVDVGLGYMELGQSASTLSGGEAQRLKLARELARPSTGQTFYILDEPTTGLHFDDVARLLEVLSKLVDQGNTVAMIEHNVGVILSADWVIDLGPDGGDAGGGLVAAGTPEDIAASPDSHTGLILKESLKTIRRRSERAKPEPVGTERVERVDGDANAAVLEPVAAGTDDEISLDEADPRELSEKPPWKADGRAWHMDMTRLRADKSPRWEAELLTDLVQTIGDTVPVRVSWTNRCFLTFWFKEHGWGQWCRVHTDAADAIRMVCFVPQGIFGDKELSALRMRVVDVNHGWYGTDVDWVTIEKGVVASSDFDGEDFSGFLRTCRERLVALQSRVAEAAESAESTTALLEPAADDSDEEIELDEADPKDLSEKPLWKIDGQAWHTDPERPRKGGVSPSWDTNAVTAAVSLIEAAAPVKVTWTNQHFVTIRPRRYSWGVWCRLMTYDPDAMHIVFQGRVDEAHEERFEPLGFEGGDKSWDWHGTDWGWISKPAVGVEDFDTDEFRQFARGAYDEFLAAQDDHVRRHDSEAIVAAADGDTAEPDDDTSEDDENGAPVAEDVDPPWKTDGRSWHLDAARERSGRRPVWDPDALQHVIDEALKLGDVEARWNSRATVSLRPRGGKIWMEIRTDNWRYFRIRVNVPKGTFDGDRLRKELDLRLFAEIDDVPLYTSPARVRMNGRGKDWTRVDVVGCLRRELDTDGFRAFLRTGFEKFVGAD